MITFDECGEMLDEIADSVPYELYRELNGGITLREETRLHPLAKNNDLYILGVYVHDNLGRYINIYYGSFIKVFANKSKSESYNELKRILLHEIRHHNEFLAGVDDLVLYDNEQIKNYLESKKGS